MEDSSYPVSVLYGINRIVFGAYGKEGSIPSSPFAVSEHSIKSTCHDFLSHQTPKLLQWRGQQRHWIKNRRKQDE